MNFIYFKHLSPIIHNYEDGLMLDHSYLSL